MTMVNDILVPIDGSAHAYGGLVFAIETFPAASVTTLHASDSGRDTTVDPDRSARYHERAASIAAERDVELSSETHEGVPHRVILERAASGSFDLVCLGSHGASPITGAFVGHVTESVIRRTPISAAIVPLTDEQVGDGTYPGHVLLPTDGSDPAREALEFLAYALPDAKITALHVMDLGIDSASLAAVAGTYVEEQLEVHRRIAEELLDRTRTEAADLGISVETDSTIGRPRHAILDYAAEHQCDTIVMGRHGRTGLRRGFLGSVAEAIAHRSSIPVVLPQGESRP